MSCLCLFAHQDDEFGLYTVLQNASQQQEKLFCVYLTNGGKNAQRRNEESRYVLSRLGVARANIFFPGTELAFEDGRLHLSFGAALEWLTTFLATHRDLQEIYVPAFEGGHPDHDTVYALGFLLKQKGLLNGTLWQYSLYTLKHCLYPFFRAMHPFAENGSICALPIPFSVRLRFLPLLLSYPTQWRSWLGLFWPVACTYLFRATQTLQKATRPPSHRPHNGPLYYEKRGFLTWEEWIATLAPYLLALERL